MAEDAGKRSRTHAYIAIAGCCAVFAFLIVTVVAILAKEQLTAVAPWALGGMAALGVGLGLALARDGGNDDERK